MARCDFSAAATKVMRVMFSSAYWLNFPKTCFP